MRSKEEIEGVTLKNGGNTDREKRGVSVPLSGAKPGPCLEAPYWISVRATQNPAAVSDAFLERVRMSRTVVYVKKSTKILLIPNPKPPCRHPNRYTYTAENSISGHPCSFRNVIRSEHISDPRTHMVESANQFLQVVL